MNRFIIMDERDMVAIALVDLHKGELADVFNSENISLFSVTALENIPFGNKIALVDIKKGGKVIKYGTVIGECTHSIRKGELVHVHNVISLTVDIPPVIRKEIMRQMNIQAKEDE